MQTTRTRTPLADGTLPDGFPREIEADGRTWTFTGKVGTDRKTGQDSAEYGTDAIRYWRNEDSTIEED